ncbi:GLUG motif-containing protein [Jutongia sp.]|uniref:GLUG motif-containing protein n=1 Tax=Jutongia sp. TaxID=2944204 RepID=UPI00307A5220
MKQRKRGIRRMFAGAMAAFMVLSAVDVSGWGVMNAKAEETAVGTNPQYLTIGSTKIIDNGIFQNNEVSGNDTIYQGTNWYYDSTKNQLVLDGADGASVSDDILNIDGNLAIILSGTNTMRMILSELNDGQIEQTLEINGSNYNGSLSCRIISTEGRKSIKSNLNIIGATLATSQIDCDGSLTIENSHVVANDEDYPVLICGDKINIVDSYVEAKTTTDRHEGKVIRSNQPINVSESQIVVSRALACTDPVLSDCSFSNSVITKKWKDYETKDNVTKTSVYGKATLKEDLTIASGESIEFESGASITNPEKLTLEDGASLFVNGEEHIHNKDGDVTYTWKDDNKHIKNVACKDCPIGYVTNETESHSIGENGFCACNEVYQPANLTTDKYDINGDKIKDEVYEISNAGQLYWFAGLVNGTLSGVTQDTSANAVLTADIVVNKNVLKSDGSLNDGTFKEWTPIGNTCNGSYSPYIGIFEGQNHTISGLYFKQDIDEVGLFGYNGGKISNVGILDSYFCGASQVGGVCGYNSSTITNCYNKGVVDGTVDAANSFGGVCGCNFGILTNCYNTGVVKGHESVGGVSGDNSGTITNCNNEGKVSGTEDYVGGVSGENNKTITNCYNTGIVSGQAYVGGVSGGNNKTITNCYNTGIVSGQAYVGGVNGYNVNGTIINCNATGEVNGTDSYVGGVIGMNLSKGTITNCYYDSTVYTGAAIGKDMGTTTKVEGKTTEQYKIGEVAYLLQESQSDTEIIWGQTIGKDTYPTLGGSKVYKNATYKGCEGKPGDAVSYEYSNTEKNTYGDHPDADNDGRCDDCGQYIDGIGAKLAGYSLSLTGNIGVNFYMELSNDIVNDESAYMNFILPNGTTSKVYVSGTHEDGSTATTDTTVKDGVTYYVFTCEVAAKEMTSDIQAQMIGNNGEKKGTVHTYTVKEYADYILSHMSADESLTSRATIQLVKGMLNYGGAAQKYFGYKTDKLASDGLTLTGAVFNDTSIINNITNEANKASVTHDNAKVTFKSAYLSLNSTPDLCVSVQFADDVTVKEDMFAIWCNTDQISKDQYEVTKVNEENCYKITLHGMKASMLNEKYAFYVELSDTEYAELAYGADSYAYTVMSSACDNINNIESLREVVKALYAYGICARNYESYKNEGSN